MTVRMIDWIDANPFLRRYRFPSGSEAYHTGADLNLNVPVADADAGAPVYAVAHGQVTFARRVPLGTWGNLIVIEHTLPNGSVVHSRYGHLRQIAITEGQYVLRGQMIGTIGGSEFGLPNHLHFDISTSGILALTPVYWPGLDLNGVKMHFVDPRAFLAGHGPKAPSSAPQPAPKPLPQPVTIDLLPYLRGDGRIYGLQVLWGGQEHYQQLQTVEADGLFYICKNHLWEQLWLSNGYIYRGADTSYSEAEYYVQRDNPDAYGARWCRQRMSVGEVFGRSPTITVYNKRDGHIVSGPALSVTGLRLSAYHVSWRMNAPMALAFDDVVELTWLVGGTPAETYWYARDYGLVGWRDDRGPNLAYTVERFASGQRAPILREKVAGPAAPYGERDYSLIGRVRMALFGR